MPRRSAPLALGLIFAALIAHALSYGLNVQDDAFISYRYAQNLAGGHGLVFNPGERVEGITNLLWTVGLAGVIRLGGDPLLASVLGGVLGALGLAWVTWALGARREGETRALVAPALIAASPYLMVEAVQGLESSTFAAVAGLAALLALDEDEGRRAWPAAGLCCAALSLLRPEGVGVYGLLLLGLTLGAAAERGLPAAFSPPRRVLWWGLGLLFAALLAQTAARLAYYGQPLPNTFYVKTGGGVDQWSRGVLYLVACAKAHPVETLLLSVGVVAAAREAKTSPWARAMLTLGLGYLAYIVAVGGDFKVTFRFVGLVAAPLALLVQRGLWWAIDALPAAAPRVALGAAVALGTIALDLAPSQARMAQEARFRAQVMEDRLAVGRALRELVPPDAVLAIHSAGAIPYAAGLSTIDMWGLSDLHIAHREMPQMGSGMAGHEKSDYAYVFGRAPTIFIPEEGFLVDQPTKLPVPGVPEFTEHYAQRAVPLGDRTLQLFVRVR
ncbi:hypothetical protein L6R49_05410 [Myxococcota bacterium]|nr:hypothetical protein [Myxococcota bacterium]